MTKRLLLTDVVKKKKVGVSVLMLVTWLACGVYNKGNADRARVGCFAIDIQ